MALLNPNHVQAHLPAGTIIMMALILIILFLVVSINIKAQCK
jgi:hypothetical protein